MENKKSSLLQKIWKAAKYTGVIFAIIILLFLGNKAYYSVRKVFLTDQEKQLEDLEYLDNVIRTMHADFSLYADGNVYNRLFEETKKNIENQSASDPSLLVSYFKLVASLNDPHTQVNNRYELMGGVFPYYILWFDDGPRLVSSDVKYQTHLGARVVKIDTTGIHRTYEKLRQVVPHSNETGYKNAISAYLRMPGLLFELGISSNRDQISLIIENSSGESDTLLYRAMPWDKFLNYDAYQNIRAEWKDQDFPLYQQNRSKNYWYSFLENDQILYLKYNSAVDGSGKSGIQFWEEVLEKADSAKVEKFIIDARGNGGGDNFFHMPLVAGLKKHPDLNKGGKLFTIVDRGTFSAAIAFIADMERETNTIFVGEHAGDRPNTTGDTRYFTLPHSGLQAGIATLRWENTHSYDSRSGIEPDIYVGKYFNDFTNGSDPALNAILNYQDSNEISEKREAAPSIPDSLINQQFVFSPFQSFRIEAQKDDTINISISGLADYPLTHISDTRFQSSKFNTSLTIGSNPEPGLTISIFDTTLALKPFQDDDIDVIETIKSGNFLNSRELLNRLRNENEFSHFPDRTHLNMLAFRSFYYDQDPEAAFDFIRLNEEINGDDPFVYIRKAQLQDLTQTGGSFWSYMVTGRKIFKRYFTVEYMNDHYLPF